MRKNWMHFLRGLRKRKDNPEIEKGNIINSDDYLSITFPICELEGGYLKIPASKRHVHIDVGLSINAPNLVSCMNRRDDVFGIGVEPNPEHFYGLLAYEQIARNPWILGYDTQAIEKERSARRKNSKINEIFLNDMCEFLRGKKYGSDIIIVPAAIATEEGFGKLFMHSHTGFSSLDNTWVDTERSVVCPTIKLKTIVDRIPPRYQYISHLKIDAEGLDMDVFRSLEERIDRIAYVTLETPNNTQMKRYGFKEILRQNGGVTFLNAKAKNLPDDVDYLIRI